MDKEMIRLRIIAMQDAVKHTSSHYLRKDYRKRIKALQKQYNALIRAEKKGSLEEATHSRLAEMENDLHIPSPIVSQGGKSGKKH